MTEAVEKTGATTNWSQAFNYDRYGNRIGINQAIGSLILNTTPTISESTNRFTSTNFGYDKNGNVINDIDPLSTLPRSFVFNGDNKQTEVKRDGVTIGRYYYDGEGKRVKKVTDQETTVFVYSSGKLIAEYSTQLSQMPSIAYTTTDHLGTPRVITNELGQVKARRDFMPFGEEIYTGVGARSPSLNYGTNQDDIRQKFTGYQKDNETGLDFAEARMYENRHGRFTAVDPLLASGRSANPQTFNRYAYVSGNPLIRTDPTGLDWYRQAIKDSDRFTYQWFDENPGDEWSAVDFGENDWITVPNWCTGGNCGDGNQTGYLYKSGGHDLGHRANGIILNILSDAGLGTAKFAYNSYVPINNGFWWALSRPSPFAYNGSETKAPYQMSYWEPETDGEAGVGLALTAVSLYRAAASAGAGRPIRFAGFSASGNSGTSLVGSGNAYSVAFETRLAPSSYPGASRTQHFQEANRNLFSAMQADASFGKSMSNLGISIPTSSTGTILGRSPTNWTWHHAREPGVLQLVPRVQHQAPGPLQNLFHPNGRGGFKIWGQ